MALNDTILNIGAAAMQVAMTHLQIHTAEPNASGSNEATSTRLSITWVTAANGDMVATVDLPFTGGAGSGAATHAGFWSAVSAGTFYGWQVLTGDQTFNAAGEYTVTGISIPGTAS
jgi:hypothetical protein